VIEKIELIFRDVFFDENLEITDSTSPVELEEWDSLAQINLLIAIENEFNIKFSLDDAQKINSVGDILSIIDSKKNSS